jgi:hypothetical protein
MLKECCDSDVSEGPDGGVSKHLLKARLFLHIEMRA